MYKQHYDARQACPRCGSTTFNIQDMGSSTYVFCGGDCEHHIIGKLDPWDGPTEVSR